MKKRKIGSITPLWNQELFIGPHFDMLKSLDRNLVLLQSAPLPSYRREHGYSTNKDRSEAALRKFFPQVEIVASNYPPEMDFGAGLYNEGLAMMEDCDIVLRLDPDMLFTKKDWEAFVELLRTTEYDSYRMDFERNSINYYMTGDFVHGLRDAKEFDPLAIDPKKRFTDILIYPATNPTLIRLGNNWTCHHFRGWNKPKSVPNPGWLKRQYAKDAFPLYNNNGNWYHCDPEVQKKMKQWLKELEGLQ